MTATERAILAAILGLAWHVRAAGQVAEAVPEPPQDQQEPRGQISDDEFRLPLEPGVAQEVDQLVALLNSPTFKEREQAAARLLEIGAPAFAKLRDAYRQSDELEPRLQIEQLIRTAYLNYHVLDRNGFLGVSLSAVGQAQRPPGKAPAPPEAEGGLQIGQVTSGTGAARAGLKAGDIIMALNDKSFRNEGNDTFSQAIRKFRPGTVIRLSIIRDGKPMVIDAELGRCPEEVLQRSRVLFQTEYYEASNRFPTWWEKYFAPTAHEPAPQP